MPTTKKSTFDTLYAVNVSDKIEKKGISRLLVLGICMGRGQKGLP